MNSADEVLVIVAFTIIASIVGIAGIISHYNLRKGDHGTEEAKTVMGLGYIEAPHPRWDSKTLWVKPELVEDKE